MFFSLNFDYLFLKWQLSIFFKAILNEAFVPAFALINYFPNYSFHLSDFPVLVTAGWLTAIGHRSHRKPHSEGHVRL